MSTPGGAPHPLLRAGSAPLIGRSLQLAILAEHLAEACHAAGTRRPPVVLLSGAPGIGKTRLLEEFPPPEQAAGLTVLRGGASQAAGMPPYLPFLQALGDYIAAAPADRLRDQIGQHAATLGMLFAEIPARFGSLPPPHPLSPEQVRFRLYEAVAVFLAAIAERHPLVLLLDDLQWADAASCDLLVHVASRLRSAPLLIVGAYRAGEAAENLAFARTLAELNRQRLLVTLTLDPLDAEESRAFVTNLLRGPIAPAAADLLHRHGEGNPFFLEELLRALVEEGTLIWQAGCWEVGSALGPLLPPRVVEAIRMRLARLDPAVVELLRLADLAFHFAEAGETARGVTYALAAGERALRASAAVEALAHYRTAVRLLGASGEPAVQTAALTGLGDAATLAGDYGAAAEAYTAAQETWLRSGDLAAAARAWRRVGQVRWRQEAVGAIHEAFERSLELLGPEDSSDAAETLLQLADLNVTSLGRNAEAIAYAERALAMVARLGDRRLEAEACCVLGNIKIRSNDSTSGRALLDRALALAQEHAAPILAAEACAHLTNIFAKTGVENRAGATAFALRHGLA